MPADPGLLINLAIKGIRDNTFNPGYVSMEQIQTLSNDELYTLNSILKTYLYRVNLALENEDLAFQERINLTRAADTLEAVHENVLIFGKQRGITCPVCGHFHVDYINFCSLCGHPITISKEVLN